MSREEKTPPAPEAPAADATPLEILEREFKKFWTNLDGEAGPTEAATRAKSDLEDRIKNAPWAAAGLIAAVAIVIGYLLGSRRSK